MARTLPKYPKDHPLGMVVPKGGSDCAKCKFLVDETHCREPHFRQWNGGPELPAPADEYCCDFFTTAARTKPRSAKELRTVK
jgi:hypothetical protein